MPNQSADHMNTGLLRRRLIFADPERSIVRISPDGTRIAFRAPVDGVLNLWVAPLDRIDDARPVTSGDRPQSRSLDHLDARQPTRRVLPRGGRRRKLACLAGRSGNRRCAGADAGSGGEMLHSAKLAPFSQRIADRAQRAGQALLRRLPRERCDWGKHAGSAERGLSPTISPISSSACASPCATPKTAMSSICSAARDGEWALFSRIGAEDAMATRAIEFSADGQRTLLARQPGPRHRRRCRARPRKRHDAGSRGRSPCRFHRAVCSIR